MLTSDIAYKDVSHAPPFNHSAIAGLCQLACDR